MERNRSIRAALNGANGGIWLEIDGKFGAFPAAQPGAGRSPLFFLTSLCILNSYLNQVIRQVLLGIMESWKCRNNPFCHFINLSWQRRSQ
ncbi:MAG: hypothetical protein C4530_07105 [Desulfobacteraceae bacterium]|nr:MAG: hypothetical protein C4530_07105 [Desulfobacteraceae bacterium]